MLISKQQSISLKGVAVIFLLIHHLFGFSDQFPEMQHVIYLATINGNTVETSIGIFGKICVAMFIFLSGYGIASKNNISYSYVIGRLKELYLFYWITFFLFVSIGIIFFSSKSGFTFEPIKIILDLTGITHYYNASTWFLSTYIFCLLLSPLIINLKNIKLLLIAYLVLFISHHAMRKGGKGGFSHNDLYFIITSCFYYVFPFIAGIIFHRTVINKSKYFIYVISFILFVLMLYFYPKNITAYSVITPLFIILLLPIVSIQYISTIFSFLGNNSLGIWLTDAARDN